MANNRNTANTANSPESSAKPESESAGDTAATEQAAETSSPYLWVMSNRIDDRVVLFERDPDHPSGEAFVGGSGPARVGRTTRVVTLLREGLLVEVPEPVEGRKKPVLPPELTDPPPATQPGQPIALGREPDLELFGNRIEAVRKSQAAAPNEIPVPLGVTVPPPPEPSRETSRR